VYDSAGAGAAAGAGGLAFTGTSSLTLAGIAFATVFAGLTLLRLAKKLTD
jgi:hypothetical protein